MKTGHEFNCCVFISRECMYTTYPLREHLRKSETQLPPNIWYKRRKSGLDLKG